MTSETEITGVSGWTCPTCHEWIAEGRLHACESQHSDAQPSERYEPVPIIRDDGDTQYDVLRRIEATLAEILETVERICRRMGGNFND